MPIDKVNIHFEMIFEGLVKEIFECGRGGAEGMANADFYNNHFIENPAENVEHLKKIFNKVIEENSENEIIVDKMLELITESNSIENEEEVQGIIIKTIDFLNENGY